MSTLRQLELTEDGFGNECLLELPIKRSSLSGGSSWQSLKARIDKSFHIE